MDYQFSVKKVTLKNRTIYESSEINIPVQGITVIVGRNGCGKTTLINHIMYSNPQQIALIAQENDLIFNDMSIEDNIMLFNPDKNKLLELLKLFGIEYILERNPKHLSGGEKRIIAILRMFFVDKDIVFIDEPTNDLDYCVVEKVKMIILGLAKQKSILIVTHDTRISSLADKMYRISDGRIISDDECKDKEYKEIDMKESNKTIGKLIKMDFVGNLLFALLIFSIICSGFFAIFTDTEKIDYIKDEQTNIASKFYTGLNVMNLNGYIPLEAYKSYEGKIDEDFLNIYYESLKNAGSQGGSLNMYIDKQFGDEVYLAIFFDAITNKKIYVMQDYQKLREIQIGKKPDISRYVSIFDGVSEVAVISQNCIDEPIITNIYYTLEESYIKEYPDYQPVLYIILNMDETQLMSLEGNIFIKNNVTVDICNTINEIKVLINSMVVFGMAMVGSLLLYYLYIFVSLKLYKKHITILRNLGVSVDIVREEMFRKKCTPIVKILIVGCGILVSVISMYFYTEYVLLMSLVACISGVVGMCAIIITRKILFRNINKVYNYGGIYES